MGPALLSPFGLILYPLLISPWEGEGRVEREGRLWGWPSPVKGGGCLCSAPPPAYPCVRFAPRPLSILERGRWRGRGDCRSHRRRASPARVTSFARAPVAGPLGLREGDVSTSPSSWCGGLWGCCVEGGVGSARCLPRSGVGSLGCACSRACCRTSGLREGGGTSGIFRGRC